MRAAAVTERVPAQVEPGMVLVDVHGQPDDFGRSPFTAWWHEDRRWLGGGMVAGQVFCARLDEFAGRWQDDGRTVTLMR